MSLLLFADKLPAELQADYKAQIAKYILVSSRDEARNLIASNEFLQSEFQSVLSQKHEESIKKFNAEKLPLLLEEEIKKRGTKQPWEIEIEKMKSENAELNRQIVLKERKNQAIAELNKIGLDPELADFVVDDDETKFKEKISKLTGKVTSWRDQAIKQTKEGIFNTATPQAGSTGNSTEFQALYDKAIKENNVDAAIFYKGKMQEQLTKPGV